MGQNGIPLFYFYFKLTNKKVFFNGINVLFQFVVKVSEALFFRLRNGIKLMSQGKRGEYWTKLLRTAKMYN